MNTSELEHELTRHRGASAPPSTAIALTVDEALDYRSRGNLPDGAGRTLRLVLHIASRADLKALDAKRLVFEPDFHHHPRWRKQGSAGINIVPLRINELEPATETAWWEDPELSSLEREWADTGKVAGLNVPGSYRGFIYKTVLALKRAGEPITADAVAGSVARWLPEAEAETLRVSLLKLNRED